MRKNESIIENGLNMLETPQERVKLLKAGISYKTIEKLYLIYNNFKIVRIPTLFEPVEIDFFAIASS